MQCFVDDLELDRWQIYIAMYVTKYLEAHWHVYFYDGTVMLSITADVWSASSLTTFRQKLKTYLFWQSYPDIVL